MGCMNLAARAAGAHVKRTRAAHPSESRTPAAVETPTESAPVADTIKELVEFIPTEAITLFWLGVPATRTLSSLIWSKPVQPNFLDYAVLLGLVGFTPALVILSFLSSLSRQHVDWPEWRRWPWWKALAACIAFGVWAFAVPGNPFITNPAILVVIWPGAAFVSTLLGLLDPIVVDRANRKALGAPGGGPTS